jgi:hypothetical protein
MALNRRQNRLYKNLAKIWRPAYQKDAPTKEETETRYEPVATGVSCLYTNQESPESVGAGGFPRYEQPSFFTRDVWDFAIDVEIDAEYLIQDQTVDRFGNPSPHFGRYWLVVGTPQKLPSLGRRNCNMKRCLTIEQPTPPGIIDS